MNRGKIIKLLSLTIALAFLFTACASDTTTTVSETTAAGETTTAAADDDDSDETTDEVTYDEIIEVEFMNMNEGWNPRFWAGNPVGDAIIAATGVEFKVSAPTGDAEQMANVMLVSNDYPEVMQFSGRLGASLQRYIDAGALHAFDDLAAEHNYPNIMNGTTVPTRAINVHRNAADDKLYTVPAWYSEDGFGSIGHGINVRMDIYEDLGSPELATMDDYYDFLVAVRDAGMETVDGLQVWGLSLRGIEENYIGYVANIYGANTLNYLFYNENNQRVEIILKLPELIDALNFLNRGYNEGLLDPESFTFDRQQMDEAYISGRYATVMASFWNLWQTDAPLSQIDERMYYQNIPIPQGTPGVQQYFGNFGTVGGVGLSVTKNAENTEAITRVIDFLLSDEGQILDFYGIEGETMEFVDGEPRFLPGVYEAKLADWHPYGEETGVRWLDLVPNQRWNWERHVESEDRAANRARAAEYGFSGDFINALQVSAATPEGILIDEIMSEMQAELTRMIITEDGSQIPGMIERLLAEYEGRGLEALEDELSRQYNRLLELEG